MDRPIATMTPTASATPTEALPTPTDTPTPTPTPSSTVVPPPTIVFADVTEIAGLLYDHSFVTTAFDSGIKRWGGGVGAGDFDLVIAQEEPGCPTEDLGHDVLP